MDSLLIDTISKYLVVVKLLDFIPKDRLMPNFLCMNPKINRTLINYMIQNGTVNWNLLSVNDSKYAVDMCYEHKIIPRKIKIPNHPEKIDDILSKIDISPPRRNESSILNELDKLRLCSSNDPVLYKILLNDLSKIHWRALSRNSNSLTIKYILMKYPSKIDWDNLCKNTNPMVYQLLVSNPEKINWQFLSGNPNSATIKLLYDNVDKIEWESLVLRNTNPLIIPLLKNKIETDPDCISWDYLSENPVIFSEIYIDLKTVL